MDVRVNDILLMKKPHPCGAFRFLVLRSGMDFKLRCCGCGREMRSSSRQTACTTGKSSGRRGNAIS